MQFDSLVADDDVLGGNAFVDLLPSLLCADDMLRFREAIVSVSRN